MATKKRGFALLSPQARQEIARKGIQASQKTGLSMSERGKLGGKVTSSDRKHMADIGRKGGFK
jgi:uncharacterized protein